MKLLLALALTVAASTPALARDSSHLVCSGYMAAKPGPDNYGISVNFDEGRASDGSARLEMLSSIWAGDLYQGQRINTADDFGKNGTVVLAAKQDATRVFYKGDYNLIKDGKTGKYALHLKGQMNLDPSDSSAASFEPISTALPCVDISN